MVGLLDNTSEAEVGAGLCLVEADSPRAVRWSWGRSGAHADSPEARARGTGDASDGEAGSGSVASPRPPRRSAPASVRVRRTQSADAVSVPSGRRRTAPPRLRRFEVSPVGSSMDGAPQVRTSSAAQSELEARLSVHDAGGDVRASFSLD